MRGTRAGTPRRRGTGHIHAGHAAAGLAAALLLVAGCTGEPAATSTAGTGPEAARTSVPPVPALRPPRPDSRWVGVNGAMVAVPARWRTATGPCGEPDGPVVHFPGRRAPFVDCSDLPTSGVASLTVASARSEVLWLERRRLVTTRVDGLTVRRSRPVCLPHPPQPRLCRTTVLVPGADAAFQVSAQGPGAVRLGRAVLGSLRRVPEGYTAVPLVEYGASVDRAKEQLRRHGLDAVSPEVDFPHYATGTEPVTGTVVPEGSTVTLTIGDG